MPHLVIEVSRGSIERRLLTIPVEVDASGAPADILAPPLPIRRTTPTALGTVRTQVLVQTVRLQAVTGSGQSVLALDFDQGSVEFLSIGQSEGMLGGNISVPFTLGFVAAAGANGGTVARLTADFSATTVQFAFDPASKARVVDRVGAALANLTEVAVGAALTAQFQGLGAQPTGLDLGLTPGVPSERLLTVFDLPGAVWVDADTLALALRYAPEPVPPPFQPVPFLPPGATSAFGLRVSNDGFQRAVRNPAVRSLARDMLTARLIDGFVQTVYAQRGGQGGPTAQDRAEGRKRLDDYLSTPQGRSDLAAETPAPTGGGRLRKRVTNVPDPFSDFDVEVPELDLWLGVDRIEGRARATGEVNGFGFTADVRFRARPVLVTSPSLAIEMHDIEIDDPDLTISLPPWLEWLAGALVGLLVGPVFGTIFGFLFSSILSSLAEAFIPSSLGSQIPPPQGQAIGRLPRGVTLSALRVVPEFLEMSGGWQVQIDDPRPFHPWVTIVDSVEASATGFSRDGEAWFSCLGALGVLMDSNAQYGNAFGYLFRTWRSRVRAALVSTAVPLPLTRFPWIIEVGYRSTAMYHAPIMVTPPVPLVPGPMTVTSDVWHPEPPLTGTVSGQTFTIEVRREDEDTFTLDVPPEAACIIITLSTQVIDRSGVVWKVSAQIDVVSETVTFGAAFEEFGTQCEGGRREWQLFEDPSLLEQVWYPPDTFARVVARAIRTEQPAVTTEIASLLELRGKEGLALLLSPSLLPGPRSVE